MFSLFFTLKHNEKQVNKIQNIYFYLTVSVHADLGVDYKILRERFFFTLLPTTATLKHIKETIYFLILPFFWFINKMLMPLIDRCDAICWMNKDICISEQSHYFSTLSISICYPHPNIFITTIIFFQHCIREVSWFVASLGMFGMMTC